MTNFYTQQKTKQSYTRTLGVSFLSVIFLFSLAHNVSAETFAITTLFPSKNDSKSMILRGMVANNANAFSSTWFEYGKNGSFQFTTEKRSTYESTDFYAFVYNLEPGVVYSYRAAGRQATGSYVVYGEVKTFTMEGTVTSSSQTTSQTNTQTSTQSGGTVLNGGTSSYTQPTVTVGGATVAQESSAVFEGVVTTGGVPATGWFEWGATESLGNETPDQDIPAQIGQISLKAKVDGLSQNTTYFYRPVVLTEAGLVKGPVSTITTKKSGSGGVFGSIFGGGSNSAGEGGSVSLGGSGTESGNSSGNMQFNGDVEEEKEVVGALGWGSTLQKQFFTIDAEGNIHASKETFSSSKNNASVFGAGTLSLGGFLPETFFGWFLWTIIILVGVIQLRVYMLNKKRRKEEREQEELEMQEIKKYQEVSFLKEKEKTPA